MTAYAARDPDEVRTAQERRAAQDALRRDFENLDRLAHLLDTRWTIPGTSIRFGLDAVAGLLPGVGDAAAGIVAGYIILQAARMGVSGSVLMRMALNVAVDTAFGSIPLAGSVFDVFYKANRRNIRLLRNHLEGWHRAQGPL